MARAVGDQAAAEQYRAICESGTKKLDAELFNDDYFIQRYNESEHAKYQFGEGCLSDELLGDWFAAVVKLGPLLPREHVRKTLHSIYRNNFRHDFMDFANPQRIYALNDEKGLLLCSWPKGKRPALPFVYSDEVWTGIEYQVAAHLMYEGMVDEGLVSCGPAGIAMTACGGIHGTKWSAARIMRGRWRAGRCSWRCPGTIIQRRGSGSPSRLL